MKQTFVVAMITLREAMPAGSHEHCTTSTESPAQDGPTYIPSGPGGRTIWLLGPPCEISAVFCSSCHTFPMKITVFHLKSKFLAGES